LLKTLSIPDPESVSTGFLLLNFFLFVSVALA